MKRYLKITAIFTVMFLCLLTACSKNNKEPQASPSPTTIYEKEISELYPDITILSPTDSYEADPESEENLNPESEEDLDPEPEKDLDPIVGTWINKRGVYTEIERWTMIYKTCFSPDGQVVHYGNRNIDRGTWTRMDENTVTAYFDECTYTAVGSYECALPSYQVTYIYDAEERVLNRQTDRADKLTYEVKWNDNTEVYTATDFDTYEKPLHRDSDECTILDYYPCYPEKTEYCSALEKALLSLADDLLTGAEVKLERADLPYELENVSIYDLTGDGKPEIFAYVEMCHSFDNSGVLYILSQKPDGEYTILSKNTACHCSEFLAPDGTELLSLSIYVSSSSWESGARVHLGYREDQVVVDRDEHYSFHWDYPLINYVNDYKNGKYYVYVSREDDTGGEGYGSYVSLEQSLKIDEETFSPMLVPFTGYETSNTDYPAIYHLWSPFDEGWWQDGGSYPGDEDPYGRTADWSITAADDHPDEMLQEAVEKSGLKLEKKAYPWTPETKKNVTDLLRCPVADYYYQSDYYAAVYMRGQICFYEKEILPDGYEEEWVLMR